MTCLHVVLESVNGSSLTSSILLVSVQRSEESFRYKGDKADRTQLIDRMMGEPFLSRPRNASFDNIDAKTVSSFHVYQIVLRISHASENSKMVL